MRTSSLNLFCGSNVVLGSQTVLLLEIAQDDFVGYLLLLGEEADVDQHVRVLAQDCVLGTAEAVAKLGKQVDLELLV